MRERAGHDLDEARRAGRKRIPKRGCDIAHGIDPHRFHPCRARDRSMIDIAEMTGRGVFAEFHRLCILLKAEDALAEAEAERLPGVESAALSNGTLALTTYDPSPVLTALAERDALQGLQVTSATLEDVFLTLTGREYRA